MPTLAPAELTTTASVNWSSFLTQLLRDYETPPAKGIAHGVQKDAIQNGWGALDGKKKFKFEFVLFERNNSKPLLTMTDCGTVGLIGEVYGHSDRKLPDALPSNQRLARFESMFDSGGTEGPGLFGRGKLLFNAASLDKLIFYDSLTKTGDYRFGIRHIDGRKFEQFPSVREGAAAKSELNTRTNGLLTPLTEVGTRITIVNPVPEVTQAIKTGDFLKAIEETWWEIIKKHDAEITVSIGKGSATKAKVPADFGALPERNEKKWRVHYRENIDVNISGDKYRIKRLHLLVPPDGHKISPDLLGVNVHRKGMKVGQVSLPVPQEIDGRFFGYVQLEPNYEEILAGVENITHYGFASLHKAPYKNLKREVQAHFDTFMEELGLKKEGVDPEKQTRRLLDDAKLELDNILRDLGVPGFGAGGGPKDDLLVSVEDLEFPDESNYLQMGDQIAGFWYKIQNNSKKSRSVWVEIYTYERDLGVIETLQSRQRIDIEPNGIHETKHFAIDVVSSHYPKFKKVGCVCKVTDNEKLEVAKKAFFFFIDLDPKEDSECAQIRLVSAEWPRNYSRRVDFGESIRDLHYEIENLSPAKMHIRLRLRTLWAAEGNTPIAEIGSRDMVLTPFQTKSFKLAQIMIDEGTYQEVGRGKVNLRSHATALERNKLWDKGDRLAEHTVSVFVNMDPTYGFFDNSESFEGGGEGPRSEAQPIIGTRSWKFRLNITHPAYLKKAEWDDDEREDYFFEEMAKQTAYVLVRTDQFETLKEIVHLDSSESLEELGHDEVLDKIAFRVTDRILATYYEG
jgi:hypothetical protein